MSADITQLSYLFFLTYILVTSLTFLQLFLYFVIRQVCNIFVHHNIVIMSSSFVIRFMEYLLVLNQDAYNHIPETIHVCCSYNL